MTYQANSAFFRSRPFQFVFFGWLIFPLIHWYLESLANKVTIAEGQLLYERGIFSKDRTEIQLSSIRTVKIYQSLINRIFGVGTVSVFTSGDMPEVVLEGFPKPSLLRESLKGGQILNGG